MYNPYLKFSFNVCFSCCWGGENVMVTYIQFSRVAYLKQFFWRLVCTNKLKKIQVDDTASEVDQINSTPKTQIIGIIFVELLEHRLSSKQSQNGLHHSIQCRQFKAQDMIDVTFFNREKERLKTPADHQKWSEVKCFIAVRQPQRR